MQGGKAEAGDALGMLGEQGVQRRWNVQKKRGETSHQRGGNTGRGYLCVAKCLVPGLGTAGPCPCHAVAQAGVRKL